MDLVRLVAASAAVAFVGLAGASAGEEKKAAAAMDHTLHIVVDGAWRTPANVARDEFRKPMQALEFWGLNPGMTILELQPGGGWWTEILAPYARMTGGRYIATAADLDNPDLSAASREARTKFETRFADKEIFGEIAYVNFGSKTTTLGAPASVDFVINGRNIHNWMGGGDMLDRVLAQSFEVLKPGGVLAIEEHRNADGAEQDPLAKSGYVTEAFVIAAAERAGFRLEARSDIFANPKDDRDHPFGVWTLPPNLRSSPAGQPADPAFDSAPYKAVGESDRMALRFVKPR